jgi:tRNA-splicing ligase RtcB
MADEILRSEPLPYKVWGAEHIDENSRNQMDAAMRLPVAVAGALMPDAHVGYGLPIGGVLAVDNAIIPYAIGVDIACFTGDTKIPLLDGKAYTLEELSKRDNPFPVYACEENGRIVIAMATAMKTRDDAELVEIELDNGEIITCTPDHEFMMRDETYREAQALQPNDSLMPFYSQLDKEGYTRIQQNYSGAWLRAHWMVARSGLMGTLPKFEGQKLVIHHIDFAKDNNLPENLEFMGDKDHASLHRNLVEKNKYWQSEEFEQRRKEALAKKAATPEGHEYFAERGGKNLKKYWEEDYERAKANCAGNGERGKPHLIARNQSEKGKALSKEIASRSHKCDICDAEVTSYIGLYNHRRLVHGVTGKLFNHKVVAVRKIERREAVYCLNVPKYHNFAISAGVFVHNCRMRVSIFEVSPIVINQKSAQFKKALETETKFGTGGKWSKNEQPEHEVLDDPDWKETPLLRSLQSKAYDQIGTSGTGNHFVEWCAVTLEKADEELGLKAGQYLALMSHSGSRGVGYQIADHYSKLAQQMHPNLDKSVRHLAWLPMTWHEGKEYWLSMNLAGRFAHANHEVIHRKLAKAVGLKPVAVVENHHNFGWVENIPAPKGFGSPEREVYVHRKGATPAGKGVMGIIPGSMGDAGYIVRGKGVAEALNSASHGAGRQMSRKQATQNITKTERDRYLKERGVTLIGGGLDEAPQAYKPIEQVISAQLDLVDVVAKIKPVMVRMATEGGDF